MRGFLFGESIFVYNERMVKAVIIYGPPGSGKGTQADLLVRKSNFVHFDTGRYLETLFRSPAAKTDPILKREKKNFDSGKLCTPEWILKITRDATKKIASAGYNIVFSGSPRTMYEAVGDKKTPGLVDTLSKLFGKENISVILLKVKDETSIDRNSHRVVCSKCGLPKLESAKLPHCAMCAGPMRTRSLDNPEVIKVRLNEYRERTFPIVAEMKKRGFKIVQLDGEPLPYLVSEKVMKALKV